MKDSEFSAHKYRYFAVAALGTFMATLDGSILNVALPTISDKLGASVGLVSWVVLSYTLTLISLMLVFGTLAQRKGYSFSYRFGFIFFLLGSLVCAFSPNIYSLITGRVVQAIGTAMFAAIGPGLVTTVFPRKERGKGIGLMVMMVSAGFMSGPPLGGFLLSYWSWESIFLINIPIGFLGLFLVQRFFGRFGIPQDDVRKPFRSAVAMSLGLVSAVFVLKMAGELGFDHPLIIGLIILTIVTLATFFRMESNPETAMIGLDIFQNRRFTIAIAAQQAHFIALSGVLLLGPFYLERVVGLEPKEVAWYLIIFPVLMLLIAPLSGRLSDRVGSKIPTTFGMLAMMVGLVLFSQFDIGTSSQFIITSLVFVGLGVGAFSSSNSSALMGSVEEKHLAVTSSILATNRNIGHAVGVAVATAVFSYFGDRAAQDNGVAAQFVFSLRPVVYVALGFAFVGFLLCLARPGGHPVPQTSKEEADSKYDSVDSEKQAVACNKTIDSGR